MMSSTAVARTTPYERTTAACARCDPRSTRCRSALPTSPLSSTESICTNSPTSPRAFPHGTGLPAGAHASGMYPTCALKSFRSPVIADLTCSSSRLPVPSAPLPHASLSLTTTTCRTGKLRQQYGRTSMPRFSLCPGAGFVSHTTVECRPSAPNPREFGNKW